MTDRIEALLSELVAEMKNHHAYVVARDAQLDAKDEQDDAERRERQARVDDAMKKSLAMQEKGVAFLTPLAPTKDFDVPPAFAGGNAQ